MTFPIKGKAILWRFSTILQCHSDYTESVSAISMFSLRVYYLLHPNKTRPFASYFFADGCRRLKFLRPDDGHYLAYHVFLNLSIGIYTSCHHRCVMESRCVSVNIGPPVNDKVVCELSDSDHIQSPQHLKARRGWSYRGTTEVPMTNRSKTYVSVDKLKTGE